MTRGWTRAVFGLALGLGVVTLAPAADENEKDKKPAASSAAAKGPDWSGYIRMSEITAEVVKADDSSITIRLYSLAANKTNGRPRPQLHRGNALNLQNPLAMRRPSNGSRPQMHVEHHDYTIPYAPEGLARARTAPPKTDENGKRVPHTQKDLEDLKTPLGVSGYAIAKTDVLPGSVVDIILVRDKTIAADKVTESDLKIKYATVIQENHPAKDGTTAAQPDAKKKKN